jgi:hypothetical protein
MKLKLKKRVGENGKEKNENFGFIGCEFFIFGDLWMVCEIEEGWRMKESF